MSTTGTWIERLRDYVRESGPVGVCCVVPRVIERRGRRYYRWQAVRGQVRLSPDGVPIYAETEKPAPVRDSHLQAQRDLEQLVDSEGRVVAHILSGPLNNGEAELLLAMIADAKNRPDLWP